MESVDRDDWPDADLTRCPLADGTGADLLMFAQMHGRPIVHFICRELEQRGLVRF